VTNVLFGKLVLDKEVTNLMYGGTAVIVLGVVLTVWSASVVRIFIDMNFLPLFVSASPFFTLGALPEASSQRLSGVFISCIFRLFAENHNRKTQFNSPVPLIATFL